MKIIELKFVDLWQVTDGPTCRAEQYELTAQYHETGFAEGDILEAKDAHEARSLAKYYRKIIEKIQKQLVQSR